jgi:hypothetical protein
MIDYAATSITVSDVAARLSLTGPAAATLDEFPLTLLLHHTSA